MTAHDNRLKWRQTAGWLALVLFAGSLARFAYYALPDTSLWYDEGVQFWMSQGVNAFDLPNSVTGGLNAVLEENARGNLDPGGFTVLLHYWIKAGTAIPWMRTLPFLFFLVGLAAMALLAWRWRRNWAFALFGAVLPLAFPMLLVYATEVRAYSMEFAGVALGCLLLNELLRRNSMAWWISAGMICGFFLSSRYSYFIVAAAISAVLLWTVLARREGRQAWFCLGGFAVSLGACALAVMAVGFMPQYKMRISYNDGELLDYLNHFTAEGQAVTGLVLRLFWNLFSLEGLPLTAAALWGAVLLFKNLRGFRKQGSPDGQSPIEQQAFCVLALGCLVLTALLWRWHPWDIQQKWSLYLHALSAVMLLRGIADGLNFLDRRGVLLPKRMQLAKVVLFAAIVMSLTVKTALFRHNQQDDVYEALTYLDDRKPGRLTVAVEMAHYPVVRYFYESGALSERSYYPSAFRLPMGEGAKDLVAPRTRYMITSLKKEAFEASHPGFITAGEIRLPANLLRLEKHTPGP